mgnify:CR=1 FL=1
MSDSKGTSRMLYEIAPRNVLSFDRHFAPIRLNNLNVLIGPNGSGKSNLIELLTLLRAMPKDVRDVLRPGGGVGEWVWKGNPEGDAIIDVVIHNPYGKQSLRHSFSFRKENQSFQLTDERIENEKPYPGSAEPYFYYHFQDGNPVINVNDERRYLAKDTVQLNLSILAQRRDPEAYPEISYLASEYEKMAIYREWAFGRNAVFRGAQQADMRNDRLEEDFSNLGLFLNRLRRYPQTKRVILDRLHDLYSSFTDFDISIEAGTVQVFFTERDFNIPATRLSDGTLRYLCLLAILCDPEPPPLICIEEPELGLHPDILPKLADLLIDASKRTQLIVTTHSDVIVDALTEQPEAVLICENIHGSTSMQRLDKKKLAHWLKDYRLGQLWVRGELGGTRW